MQIRWTSKQGFFVENLLVIDCQRPQDIAEIIIGDTTTHFCDTLRAATGRCGVAIDSGTSLYAGPTK